MTRDVAFAVGFVLLAALAAVNILRFVRIRQQAGQKSLLSKRDILSPHEWHRRYFQPLGLSLDSCLRIAKLLSRRLKCEPTALRPGDRFDHELQYHGGPDTVVPDRDNTAQLERLVLNELVGPQATDVLKDCSDGRLYTLADVIRWIDDPSSRPLGRCRRCRYDLTGNVSGICPECGNAISNFVK